MPRGIETFREWFKGEEDHYVIIGGTACELLFDRADFDFRTTKDIDLVLIVEALDAAFGRKFWSYVRKAGYEHCSRSTGEVQFYRFTHPKIEDYPVMIELFARRQEAIQLPPDAVLTPIPMNESVSSLSAILLNDSYYDFLKSGRDSVSGITVLDADHIIPFKAKAWLDLSERKARGEAVDSRDIKKHKNDIFRLSMLINLNIRIQTPSDILEDLTDFISQMENEEVNLKQIGIPDKTKEQVLREIREHYIP